MESGQRSDKQHRHDDGMKDISEKNRVRLFSGEKKKERKTKVRHAPVTQQPLLVWHVDGWKSAPVLVRSK